MNKLTARGFFLLSRSFLSSFTVAAMFKSGIHVLDLDKPFIPLVFNRFGTKQAWNV